MNRDRDEALESLTQLSKGKGYLLVQDIMDDAEKYDLSIQDVDWLSNAVLTRGIMVYDDAPVVNDESDLDEYDDYAQCDYEAIYKKVVRLSPDLKPFIDDVRKIVPPQYRETSRLKYQLAEGSEYARQRMIEMYIRVAVRIALQMAERYDVDIRDTISEGCIGLIIAVDKYDPDRNGPFCSYASNWIFQNTSRYIRSQRPQIHYSVSDGDRYRAVYPILKKHGCIGCPEWYNCEKVKDIIRKKLYCNDKLTEIVFSECSPIDSLDAISEDSEPYDEYENVCECDKVTVKALYEIACEDFDRMCDVVDKHLLHDKFHSVLKRLDSKEQRVLCLRYGLEDGCTYTLEEIGDMYGLTRERIRQIESKASRKVCGYAKMLHHDDFLH